MVIAVESLDVGQEGDSQKRRRRRRRKRREQEEEAEEEESRRLAYYGEDESQSRGNTEVIREPDLDELRRSRTEYYESRQSRRQNRTLVRMPSSIGGSKTARSDRARRKHRSDRPHHAGEEDDSRRRKKKKKKIKTPLENLAGLEDEYVYRRRERGDAKSSTTRERVYRVEGSTLSGSEGGETVRISEKRYKSRERRRRSKSREKQTRAKVVYIESDNTIDPPRRHSRRSLGNDGDTLVNSRSRGSDISRHRYHGNRSRHTSRVGDSRGVAERNPPTRERRSDRVKIRRSKTSNAALGSSVKHPAAPSIMMSGTSNKRSSFLGGLFSPSVPTVPEVPALVECLTCMSDRVLRSKSAKLKCGHRMCHSCLKRIFRLSLTDPQHMPPKCCTSEHIPLKHVEKLFDRNFKISWNIKLQEYTTVNRIYCPNRRCGEWIKPSQIQEEHGYKYGKCSRCRTKVCCLCSGKWHGHKDCPNDEETSRLLEEAKKAGWQRCYGCRTMVELKEGCNHMTCRCTAEFCMVCGLKWKTCDCPWFNYEQIDDDDDDRMQDEAATREYAGGRRRRTYHGEANNNHYHRQRRQEQQEDERIARRLRNLRIETEQQQQQQQHDDSGDDVDEEDLFYQGGIGNIMGVGNGQGHFLNQNYVFTPRTPPRAAAAANNNTTNNTLNASNLNAAATTAAARAMMQASDRYPRIPPVQAPDPPPAVGPSLRRRDTFDGRYHSNSNNNLNNNDDDNIVHNNSSSNSYNHYVAASMPRRPKGFMRPQRVPSPDYATRAAAAAAAHAYARPHAHGHAPPPQSLPPRHLGRSATMPPTTTSFDRMLRGSVLAGLGGPGRYSGRVDMWMAHVEAGVEPEEGMLSM